MNKQQRQLIKQNQLITIQFAILALLISVLLFIGLQAVKVVIGDEWFNLLSNLIFAMAGSAVTILLFSWATNREIVDTTISILDNSLHEALQPIREHAIKNARHFDRYDCTISQPKKIVENGYSEYFCQTIRRTYTVEDIGKEIRAIFAVENKNNILSEYFQDERYIITYKIESRDCELDVSDSIVCHVHSVSVNGTTLKLKEQKLLSVNQADAKEYYFNVPVSQLKAPYTISVSFHVLKWHAYSTRVYIPSQIFRMTADVEYRLFVDQTVPVNNIIIDTSEITPLVPLVYDNILTQVSTIDACGCKSAVILIRSPIQAGSAVRFELHRDTDIQERQPRPQRKKQSGSEQNPCNK